MVRWLLENYPKEKKKENYPKASGLLFGITTLLKDFGIEIT